MIYLLWENYYIRLNFFYKSIWLYSVSFGHEKGKHECVCVRAFLSVNVGLSHLLMKGLSDYTMNDVTTRKKNVSLHF